MVTFDLFNASLLNKCLSRFFLNIMVAEKYIVIKNITGIVVKCIFFII